MLEKKYTKKTKQENITTNYDTTLRKKRYQCNQNNRRECPKTKRLKIKFRNNQKENINMLEVNSNISSLEKVICIT